MLRPLAFLATLLPVAAFAQQPLPPVPISQALLGHLHTYLQLGGTHAEGAALDQQMIDEIQAPQKAAQAKAEEDKRVADAVKAATEKAGDKK